jgi:hypothetical protein
MTNTPPPTPEDWVADEIQEAQALGDEDLLAQINRFDPYDVEFAKRFRALSAALAEAEGEIARLNAIVEAYEDMAPRRPTGLLKEQMKKVKERKND